MARDGVFPLFRIPVHLGLGASAIPQEPFSGDMQWYERYTERHRADGIEGRLVSLHSFSEPWSMWEMHPSGSELVVCTEGEITLHQELDGEVQSATLGPGDAIINPPGVWHTADAAAHATALFVTAGAGTQHRKR